VGSLPEELFQGLVGLRVLYLDDIVNTPPEGLFRGLVSLVSLSFTYNWTGTLPEGLFRGLKRLSRLHLDHNHLVSLPQGLFQELTELQKLSLCNNDLTSLPEGLFQGLPGLSTLELFSNRLVSFPEGLFQNLERLKWLKIGGNPHLMFFLGVLPLGLNNIESLPRIHKFFRYSCRSPLARCYQLVAGDAPPETVRPLFSTLPAGMKNALLRNIAEVSRRPMEDFDVEEQHALNDMACFGAALKKYVEESLGNLPPGYNNVPELIDAFMLFRYGTQFLPVK
jgi:hypothetical protein